MSPDSLGNTIAPILSLSVYITEIQNGFSVLINPMN